MHVTKSAPQIVNLATQVTVNGLVERRDAGDLYQAD